MLTTHFQRLMAIALSVAAARGEAFQAHAMSGHPVAGSRTGARRIHRAATKRRHVLRNRRAHR